MYVVVSPQGVELTDAENFRQFATVATPDADIDAELRDAGAGHFSGSHAWINPTWIERTAGGGDAWRTGFSGMLQFARSNEWIDPVTGYVRSHVEGPHEPDDE